MNQLAYETKNENETPYEMEKGETELEFSIEKLKREKDLERIAIEVLMEEYGDL